MASQPKNFLTLDEYLELERNSDTRTVYHNGEIFPIEAATEAHGILCVNAAAEIRGALQKAQKNTCRVIDSSVMVYQPDPGQVVRPDVFVVCGPTQFRDEHKDVILNPLLVVEVLSPSTRNYDQGDKFAYYCSIPSFSEYLTIEQDKVLVGHRQRARDASWILNTQANIDGQIYLATLDITIPMKGLYFGAV